MTSHDAASDAWIGAIFKDTSHEELYTDVTGHFFQAV